MGFLLAIIGYLLTPIVSIANFIVVMWKNAKIHNFFGTMNSYWFNDALELDRIMNYKFRDLWNVIFKGKGGYAFGNKEETISSALGKNQRDKTLSIGGWAIVVILFIIDFKYWFKGGHCINAINI